MWVTTTLFYFISSLPCIVQRNCLFRAHLSQTNLSALQWTSWINVSICIFIFYSMTLRQGFPELSEFFKANELHLCKEFSNLHENKFGIIGIHEMLPSSSLFTGQCDLEMSTQCIWRREVSIPKATHIETYALKKWDIYPKGISF